MSPCRCHCQPSTSIPFALVVSALFTACSHHVYSPPARMISLETAATLQPGEVGVAFEGNGGGVLAFGGEVAGGTARVRVGQYENFELSGEGSATFVLNEGSGDDHRGIYSARVGSKYRLTDWLSVTGGLGGGGSAAGGFFSPDLGLLVAYENLYFVPFVSGEVGVSVPFAVSAVDTSEPEEPPGSVMSEPVTTWLAGAQAGFRIPIHVNGHERFSLLGAAGLLGLLDGVDDGLLLGASAGAEYRFD